MRRKSTHSHARRACFFDRIYRIDRIAGYAIDERRRLLVERQNHAAAGVSAVHGEEENVAAVLRPPNGDRTV